MSVFVQQNNVLLNFSGSNSWNILNPLELSIKSKMESIGVPSKDWNVHIFRGILTGFNEAFIISGKKKDDLIASDPKSADIIRPILRGKDIKRYKCNFADLWIIATFPSKKYNIDEYPAVKNYLLSFSMERLEQTGKKHLVNGIEIKSRKKTSNKWFETQDSISYWNDFSQQKIVWGNLCLSAQFALADENTYINAPSPMIVPGNKYILAILNSKLGDWYIRQLGVTRNGGYFEYKPMFVEKLPIPQVNMDRQIEFINLVDKIIDYKKNKFDTLSLEEKINCMVFELYGLNQDEIEYILK